MNDDERRAQLGTRLAQIRDELISLGFEATMFWRAPGSAKAPVAYLLVGESFEDVEEARKA
ncbi:hypothetical protein B7H01_12125 [Pandoraea apista]|jgi:hypothetical protein|nr:hypothetical protein [Alcaligenes faecalis]OXS94235.1 hypothetical protein B7H01_12125 [Pandoraea apista]RSK89256.1 hypothetical protein EJF22_24130 [Pandoraea apista]CAJ0737878.1 hypothetical protein R77592_04463 [Ralstonia mannitolilytica]